MCQEANREQPGPLYHLQSPRMTKVVLVDDDYAGLGVDGDEDQDDNWYSAMSYCKELRSVKPIKRKKLCKKFDRRPLVNLLIHSSRISQPSQFVCNKKYRMLGFGPSTSQRFPKLT